VKVENNFPDVKDEISGHVERVTAKRRRTPNPTKGFEGVVSEKSIEAQLCMMPMKSIQGMSSFAGGLFFIDVAAQNRYLHLNASLRRYLGRMEVPKPTSKLDASLPTLRVQQIFEQTTQLSR